MKTLPPAGATERERDQAINELINGRSNAVGTVTLTPGATATTVSVKTGNRNAVALLQARTATAAAAAATTYAVMADASSLLITHANSGVTDRTFAYLIIGG